MSTSGLIRIILSGVSLFVSLFLTVGSLGFGASFSPERILLLLLFLSVFIGVMQRLAKNHNDDPLGFTVFGVGGGLSASLFISAVRVNWSVGDCKTGCLSLDSLVPVSFVGLVLSVVFLLPELLNVKWEA